MSDSDIDKTVLVNNLDAQGNVPSSVTNNEEEFNLNRIEKNIETEIDGGRTKFIGINPIIDAASNVFLTTTSLEEAQADDLGSLRAKFNEQIKSFEKSALQQGVLQNQVLMARYMLCSYIDETIISKPWGKDSEWSGNSLLSNLHNETNGGEKFFVIVEKISQNPSKFLYLIEFAYLCLSLGFSGKYRVLRHGYHDLELVRDSLFHKIRELRGEQSKILSPNWEPKSVVRHKLTPMVSGISVSLVLIFALCTIFGGFYYVLGEQTDEVVAEYHTLIVNDVADITKERLGDVDY